MNDIIRPFSMTRLLTILIMSGALSVAVTCVAQPEGAAPRDEQVRTIEAEALRARLSSEEPQPLVIDVREPDEFETGHIEGALLAPLGNVEQDLESIHREREIVLVCRSGRRSEAAYKALTARGFTGLSHLAGGMLAWEKLGYPVVK